MLNGWLFAKNLKLENVSCFIKEKIVERKDFSLYLNLLEKFPKDIIKIFRKEAIYFMDGYVENINSLKMKHNCPNWDDIFVTMSRKECFVKNFRGGFCGFCYDLKGEVIDAFTDHIGNRAIYYYHSGDYIILASNVEWIIETLKANQILYHLDITAIEYLLSYGYMLDNSTFVSEIKRIMPGEWVTFSKTEMHKKRYFMIDNTHPQEMSEHEAIERIDKAFRRAVKREFDKDREYGYKHLVDLSGGLDSRMVCWVAHDMGYKEQLNLSYSRSEYLDYKISQKIALKLKHMYLFNPLDDAEWLMEIDELIRKNNGAALYDGITGGNRFLKNINPYLYGIEHTGMIGDAILSTFYNQENINFGKPQFSLNKYSDKLEFQFDDIILKGYDNQEQFALYTRGFLGAQSSYIIRQHYFETASPFLDVDFLNECFKIPYRYRKNHYIYLKWINMKYYEATEFGWEKWGGVKPRQNQIFFRKIVTAYRMLDLLYVSLTGRDSIDNMNPIDYWYKQDNRIRTFMDNYFNKYINLKNISKELIEKMMYLYKEGNVTEKSMVLTVLALEKLYFNE